MDNYYLNYNYQNENYNKNPYIQDTNSKPILKDLEESLPAIFTRQTASKAIGGLISPKTLSNLDSLGEGPPKIKIGSKVGYEKTSFINWLKQRLK